MIKKWWSGGLRFSCIGCGRCCQGEPGAIWITEVEKKRIALNLDVEEDTFLNSCCTTRWGGLSLKERKNGDCFFWDRGSGKCSIYQVRPLQCRLFPFWPSILVSRENWEEQAIQCPGMDRGKYYSAEEIAGKLQLSPFPDL